MNNDVQITESEVRDLMTRIGVSMVGRANDRLLIQMIELADAIGHIRFFRFLQHTRTVNQTRRPGDGEDWRTTFAEWMRDLHDFVTYYDTDDDPDYGLADREWIPTARPFQPPY